MFVVHAGCHYYPSAAGAPDSDFVSTWDSEIDAVRAARRAFKKAADVFGSDYAWATVAVFPKPDEDAGVRTVFSLGFYNDVG